MFWAIFRTLVKTIRDVAQKEKNHLSALTKFIIKAINSSFLIDLAPIYGV